MSELEQLKKRIIESGHEGIETAIVRDDYEPAGDMMMYNLMESGEFVQRKSPPHYPYAKWRIFKKGMEPY